MRRLIAATVVLVTACRASRPIEDTVISAAARAEVEAVEHGWIAATLRGDADAFASFMADDYVAVISNARIRERAEWVEGVRSGAYQYDSVEIRNLNVRLHGSTAVVTGEYTQRATLNGQDYSARGAYVTTWQKRNGRWQAIASGFSRALTP